MKNVTFTNLVASGKDSFRYRTGDTGDVIEVEINYNNGSASRRHRGLWARVTPITLSEGCISYTLMSGFAVMVEALERARPSALIAKAERLDPQAKAIAETFAIDQAKAKEMVREIFGLAPAAVPAGGGQ